LRATKSKKGSDESVPPSLSTTLLRWYEAHGRAKLPWRASRDPYHVIVSEFMLQQTQVERVVAAYERFLTAFPTFAMLSRASRADVVRAWKGLGYNLRAVRLHELARAVVEKHGGAVPTETAALRALPGIGPYTAAAIRAFAFEIDDVAIDVNLRRVIHRLRFGLEHPPKANAVELDGAARALLPRGRAHAWNSAMMDLGATICTMRAPKCTHCPLRRSCVAAPHGEAAIARGARARRASRAVGPQGRLPFAQTRRYLRGRILDRLRALEPGEVMAAADLVAVIDAGQRQRYAFEDILEGLERDGLVTRDVGGIRLR
jgi:A/G-specific adenine glycosylase